MTTPEFQQELQGWIVNWLCRELKLSPSEISLQENLLTYGIDSVGAIMLVGDLEDRLKVRLPPTLLWDHPTIQSLMDHLATVLCDQPTNAPAAASHTAIYELGIDEAKKLLERLDELSDAQVDALLARLSRS